MEERLRRRRFDPVRAMGRMILALALATGLARAADPIDIPPWFAATFLDLREDVQDAARDKKRVMLYFGQEGCPYCKALMKAGFGDAQIAEYTRKHFVAIALDLWGDREVTTIDGSRMAEKEFARTLKVQFTPTLLFLDEKGGIALRLNGYQPPDKLRIALEYVAGREEARKAYADYLGARLSATPASGAPVDLRRSSAPGTPLLVVLERARCAECEEMRREGFARDDVRRQLARFSVVRLDVDGRSSLTLADGRETTANEWARELGIAYTPTLLFLDRGREVFRADGYLRPFHLASTLDYVASGAYRDEPSFQRFIQKRAEALRGRGEPTDLWR
jgi:thioredoxin-related protein